MSGLGTQERATGSSQGSSRPTKLGKQPPTPPVPFSGLVLQMGASLGQPQAFVLRAAETSPDLSPAL